jgi:hypothetical protein
VRPSTGRSNVLPPLISFSSAADLKRSARTTDELSKTDERLFDRLVSVGLPPLISPTVLGLILGVSPKLITSVANHPRRKYPYYRRYKIPKIRRYSDNSCAKNLSKSNPEIHSPANSRKARFPQICDRFREGTRDSSKRIHPCRRALLVEC